MGVVLQQRRNAEGEDEQQQLLPFSVCPPRVGVYVACKALRHFVYC